MITRHPTPWSRARRAFTLVELLTVIAIIGVLAGIVIPLVGKVRKNAVTTTATSNLRQVGAAMLLHAGENRGNLPPIIDTSVGPFGRPWFIALVPYLTGTSRDASAWSVDMIARDAGCPVWQNEYTPLAASDWNRLGYGMSYRLIFNSGWPPIQNHPTLLAGIANPSRTIVVAPSRSWNIDLQSSTLPAYIDPAGGLERARRHGESAVYLMADGSAHRLQADAAALRPFVVR